MNRAKKVNYADVLRERARRYHAATATPDHKALDHTALRNKQNIDRWRAQYCKQLEREDTQ